MYSFHWALPCREKIALFIWKQHAIQVLDQLHTTQQVRPLLDAARRGLILFFLWVCLISCSFLGCPMVLRRGLFGHQSYAGHRRPVVAYTN